MILRWILKLISKITFWIVEYFWMLSIFKFLRHKNKNIKGKPGKVNEKHCCSDYLKKDYLLHWIFEVKKTVFFSPVFSRRENFWKIFATDLFFLYHHFFIINVIHLLIFHFSIWILNFIIFIFLYFSSTRSAYLCENTLFLKKKHRKGYS